MAALDQRDRQPSPGAGQAGVQAELTPRQQAVMRLVIRGLADKQIAAALGIAEETVGWHLKCVFRQYGTHSRTAAAMRYLEAPSHTPA